MGIANLAMYDLPEVAAANDALWSGMARALAREGLDGAPGALTRGVDLDRLWRSPELLFSQTCGYPLTHAYKDAFRLVATPIYDAPGCDGTDYVSLIVVRVEDPARELSDLRGRAAAVTHTASQSGYSALRATVAHLAHQGRFFGKVVESGGHPNSLALVAAGEVDVCATDCVTHALLARHRPEALDGLRVLAHSPAPACPTSPAPRPTMSWWRACAPRCSPRSRIRIWRPRARRCSSPVPRCCRFRPISRSWRWRRRRARSATPKSPDTEQRSLV